MKMDDGPIMPTGSESRMLTFEEFVWSYVHRNEHIHHIINEFKPIVWNSIRISPEFFEMSRRIGLEKEVIFSLGMKTDEAKPADVGPIVTFAPQKRETSSPGIEYFLISHPFEKVTIREKLSERDLHFAYGGPLETSLVKTLCVEHPYGGYILAVLSGEANVDWKKLGRAIGLSSNKSKNLHQYNGSLEEAVGMCAGEVIPLMTLKYLPNLACVVMDSGIEMFKGEENAPYLEMPLNIPPWHIKFLSGIHDMHDRRLGIDASARRRINLAYDPRSNSLANALKQCYGREKVMVADIVN